MLLGFAGSAMGMDRLPNDLPDVFRRYRLSGDSEVRPRAKGQGARAKPPLSVQVHPFLRPTLQGFLVQAFILRCIV